MAWVAVALPQQHHTRIAHSGVATRLDLVRPAPDPPLTAILEALASVAASLAGMWGAPVARPERGRQRHRPR